MTETGPAVLIVEDEPQMRRFLRAALGSHGFKLLEASTAREAVQLATSHNPELILLDLGLPDGDGIDLTRQLREWCTAPIIVISARGREEDKVQALDAGADDYLTKPFGTNELLARMRVSLRHAQQVGSSAASPILQVGELRIDLGRREVAVGDRQVRLTPIEYKLLVYLARNAGRVLTHRQILAEIWGSTHGVQAHHVRVHMAELRKRIEVDPAQPKLLLTEPGVGYRLRDRS
ncbi:MAG: response regulator [Deltaproteobacteria bacterium]|nr:response regulator [Deltaproteobacteria bacterium]